MAHVLSGGSPPPQSCAQSRNARGPASSSPPPHSSVRAPPNATGAVSRILPPLSLHGRGGCARGSLGSRGAVAACPLSIQLRPSRPREQATGAPWRRPGGGGWGGGGGGGLTTVLAVWKSKKPGRRRSATVDLSEFSSDGTSTGTVVLTAKTKELSVSKSPSVPQNSAPAADKGPLHTMQQLLASVASVGASGTGPSASGSAREEASAPVALWVATAVLAAWAGMYVWRRMGRSETTVDALAQRGFISSDRSVRLDVIADFEDPTRVRDYRLGSAQLVELEPLAPLTEEKMRYHRELRRKEHGWKKPEHVLVEGEPVPPGIDPMSVRFIPQKHPFALAAGDAEEAWSEDVARRRLRQRRGRPEKEQARSRQQLDRVRREMKERDAAAEMKERDAAAVSPTGEEREGRGRGESHRKGENGKKKRDGKGVKSRHPSTDCALEMPI